MECGLDARRYQPLHMLEAKRERLKRSEGLLPEIQGQNLAVPVLDVVQDLRFLTNQRCSFGGIPRDRGSGLGVFAPTA